MKKILDWTLGGIFRTIGRFIGFILIGTLVAYFISKSDLRIPDFLGLMTVNASEIRPTNLNKFYVRTCDGSGSNCQWSSSSEMGTAIPTGAVVIDGFRGRFGSTNKFLKGVKYRVKFNVAMTNATSTSDCDLWYYKVRDVYCSGSLTNNWSSDPDLIDSCQFISRSCYNAGGQVRAHYYYDIVTNSDVYGFQINTYFKNQYFFNVGGINLMTSSNVTYDRDTTDAINNSTTTIINNNSENTENIINNQNENTQIINDSLHGLGDGIHDLEEAQKVCNLQQINNSITIGQDNSKLTSAGNVSNGPTYFISKFYEINSESIITHRRNVTNYMCFYDSSYTVISCYNENQGSNATFPINVTIPTNAKYVRFTITKSQPNTIFDIYSCINGNQALSESIHGVGEGIHDLNDSINSTDTSDSSNAFLDFMDNFNETDFGLASIITSPLTIITNLSTGTCSPISVGGGTGLFEGVSFELPCAMPFYEQWFGSFLELYQMITFGIISYKILLDIFRMIHNFRNPNDDRIEVLDL